MTDVLMTGPEGQTTEVHENSVATMEGLGWKLADAKAEEKPAKAKKGGKGAKTEAEE